MSNTPTSTLPTAARLIEDRGLRSSTTHQTLLPRTLAARGAVALLTANTRYWRSIAPGVRTQLANWQHAARAIPDHTLRELALDKLGDERFNVEAAATLATLAPAAHRTRVIDAIVALQVLYDYIDVLSERRDRDADRLFAPLEAAFDRRPVESDRNTLAYVYPDSRYLQALADTIRSTLRRLPNGATIAPVAGRIAARCAEAQTLHHAAPESGIEAARQWAALQSHADLEWQEMLAGSCASVLAIHALIAAAADHSTTATKAQEIAELYLLIGAMAMLDSLVDLGDDVATGKLGYLHYYEDSQLMARRLVYVARAAIARARQLRDGPHHIVTLVGVVAYYASAPTASDEPARAIIDCLRGELEPLITPTLALMRAWRLAKRIRHRSAHQSPPPRVTADDDGGPT